MATYQLFREQYLPASLDEVWDFISRPENLKKITPPHMGFDITTEHLSEEMYPGMMISYTVKPMFGIPMEWVTEITQVKEKEYFVDEQRVGPYSMWHHEHKLYEVEGGIRMTDLVTYTPPLGFLGAIAKNLFIQKQLDAIFAFRFKAAEDLFGVYKKP